MAENKRTTVIRLMQADNNPSLASMVVPMVPLAGGLFISTGGYFHETIHSEGENNEQI